MGFLSSIGNFIGGVGKAVTGVLGIGSQKDANQANADFARQQLEYQKELAKNQIQWRVDDAKKAGLHPMAALGLNSTSFSPVSLSQQGLDYSSIADGISDMGQSLNYASIKAKDNQQQQVAVRLAQEGVELQNEGLRLDNEYKRWQLLQAMETGTSQALRSPAAPTVRGDGAVIGGQPDSIIKVNPSETEANALGALGTSAASVPDVTFVRTNDGGFSMVRSESVADRLDDDMLGTLGWHLRNSVPAFLDDQDSAPPKSWLPSGATEWVFNSRRMAWYPNTHKYGKKLTEFLNPKNW